MFCSFFQRTELKQILIGNGYPADMASEMSKVEERINSNNNGSITNTHVFLQYQEFSACQMVLLILRQKS